MSDAREQLEKWAARLPLADYFKFQELFGPALTEARRETAHELAEKIRSAPGWVHGEWMDSRDRDFAADLIDPEVADG